MPEHVIKPDWFTAKFLNPGMSWLAKRGVSLRGSQELAVRGRKTGEWRRTPVNPLTYEGERYLVAPRGHVQWTHNMRAAGGGELHLGKKVEVFTAVEVPDEEKPPLLRVYIKKWRSEVGRFFGGVGPDAPEAELRRIAPNHPIFRITTVHK
jgi:deazaflavin-dependent oxidoreductase (nitroreductase family)